MSVPFEVARAEDQPQLFTIDGLASCFNISPETIRKYITWGHVNHAIGRRHDGFNYDITHYRQISRLRLAKQPLYYGRNSHAHVVTYARSVRDVQS